MEFLGFLPILRKKMDIADLVNCRNNLDYIGKITVDVFFQRGMRNENNL